VKHHFFRFFMIFILVFMSLSVSNYGMYPVGATSSILAPLFSFQSYIDVDYNASILQGEVSLKRSYNIPLNITYSSDLPEEFVDKLKPLGGFLFMQSNKIIFGQSMLQQVINISILNKEEYPWANINLTNTRIYVDTIPFKDEDVRVQTSLIFSPLERAPAQFDHITLRITCEDLGILKGVMYDSIIEFKPIIQPMISITPQDSLQLLRPNEAVNFNITVENHSNKMFRLTSMLTSNQSNWKPVINPPFCDIEPGTNSSFIYSVISPSTFGWHDDIEEFDIFFSADAFPNNENNSANETYHIQLKAKNYGFSTPSFEFIGFISAVIFLIILSKKGIWGKVFE
jgi:hypothetical protein